MSRHNLKPLTYLDGEKLFKVYFIDMGNARSTVRLVKWCASNKILNPKTGKMPSRMGVWKAMWGWAILPQNIEVAKKIFVDAMASVGEFYSDEDWKAFVSEKAKGGMELRPVKMQAFEDAVNS